MSIRLTGGDAVALAFVAGLVLAAPACADLGGFTITRFHTDLTVEPDADLIVEEHIEVDFSEPRHGIYRFIPVRYTAVDGDDWSIGFRLLGVTDESGRPHQAKVRNQGRAVRIRIGSPDRIVGGHMVYVIRYRARGALRHFPDYDELYWNATGNEWNTTMDGVSASVHLPAPLPADSLPSLGFTGPYGSRAQEVEVFLPEPGVVSYEVSHQLGPREGMTIVTTWPPGYVSFPGNASKIARFAADNWILLVPFLCFGILWRRYLRYGRDPGGPLSVMVRYEPPQNVSPGGIGTLIDERVDLRDVTATIVDLAVRGYLTVKVEEKKLLLGLMTTQETVFERNVEKSTNDLLLHERRILDGLFESGDRVEASELSQKFYKKLPAIQKSLYERLVEKGYFAGDPRAIRRRYAGLGFLFGVLTAGAGVGWILVRGDVLPTGIVAPIAAAFVTLLVFVAFSPAMPRRTRAGARMRSWALGFQEFVDRVERDRLDRDEARNVFERLLPYAMALGVSSKWARKFEGIYDQAAPAWYVGPHYGAGFTTSAFEQSLSSAMSQAGRSLTSSPRSSGSSGGFSGGGGGGGGGGSW